MENTWWTIQFATQMEACIREESTLRCWGFLPIPACPGFAQLRSDSPNPASSCPFIRRQWRHDFCWPGALTVDDFLIRASTGLIERFKQKLAPGCAINVTTSFHDRSHLGSRLKQLLMREFQNAPLEAPEATSSRAEVPSQIQNGEYERRGLHVLLTPKALLASCLLPTETGVTNSSFTTSDNGVSPSRAADKIRQALAHAYALGVVRITTEPHTNRTRSKSSDAANLPSRPLSGQLWLDLGASPGGITEALFQLGSRVIAIDRAPLHARLHEIPEIIFLRENAVEASVDRIVDAARSVKSVQIDGIVCDMNGPPQTAAHSVLRLTPLLKPGGLVVFTLKLLKVREWSDLLHTVAHILCGKNEHPRTAAEKSPKNSALNHFPPLSYIGAYHLQQNRDELTLLFRTAVQ